MIPLLIIKKKNKPIYLEKNEEQKQSLNENNDSGNERPSNIFLEIKEKENQINKIRTFTKIKVFSFIGFLYFCSYFSFYYSYLVMNTNFYGSISIVTEVFNFTIIKRIVLGNKIYSHYLFSAILLTISIFGLYFLLMKEFIQKNKNWDSWSDFVFPAILNCIAYFTFCYSLIKAKFHMEKYFIFSYELIVFLGVFCTLLLPILEPVT